MRLFRRDLFPLWLLPALARPLVGQRAGRGLDEGRPDPMPTVQPLARDLKGDRSRNLKDLDQLAGIIADLRQAIDKSDPEVVSVPLLKKANQMRSLAQKIQGRIRFEYGK